MQGEEEANPKKMLGEVIKEFEQAWRTHLPKDKPIIVRLDGCSFSKFTRGLHKPFDLNFAKAMVLTMNDLLKKSNARTGYTHSDEITLVFLPLTLMEGYTENPNKFVLSYDGQVQKWCSVYAGYCSVRFNYWFNQLVDQEIVKNTKAYAKETLDKIRSYEACFDCRVFAVPDDLWTVKTLYWRSVQDCYRNCISTYAQSYYSHKKLEGVVTDGKIAMLEAVGVTVDQIPLFLKHGVYGKRELYEKDTEVNGEIVRTIRHRVSNKSFVIKNKPEFVELIYTKDWPHDLTCFDTVFVDFNVDNKEDQEE